MQPELGTVAFEVWWMKRACERVAHRVAQADTTTARADLIRALGLALRGEPAGRMADLLQGHIDDLWSEYAAGCELVIAEAITIDEDEATLLADLEQFLAETVHPREADGE